MRLEFAALLMLVAGFASAAPPDRVVRVGVIASGPTERWALIENSVRAGLREKGYVEGTNLVLVERYVLHPGVPIAGRAEMDAAASALLAERVDVAVSGCGWSLRTLMSKTSELPIVMASVTDPVRQKFVESLARPGGNVTGVTGGAGGLGPKMLEQLRVAMPAARAVGVVYNATNSSHRARFDEVEVAARAMNLAIVPIDLRALGDATRTDALLVLPDDGAFWGYVNRIVATGLPAIFPRRDLVEMGGFMSYGSDDREVFRRAGAYVDRIVNGALPAELPIEHPKDTELVLNLRKAPAYGLTVPRTAILRADGVVR